MLFCLVCKASEQQDQVSEVWCPALGLISNLYPWDLWWKARIFWGQHRWNMVKWSHPPYAPVIVLSLHPPWFLGVFNNGEWNYDCIRYCMTLLYVICLIVCPWCPAHTIIIYRITPSDLLFWKNCWLQKVGTYHLCGVWSWLRLLLNRPCFFTHHLMQHSNHPQRHGVYLVSPTVTYRVSWKCPESTNGGYRVIDNGWRQIYDHVCTFAPPKSFKNLFFFAFLSWQ